MDGFPINAIDAIVIGVVLLSALLAFARGLVREALTIVGWGGAAAAAYFAFPYVQPFVGRWIAIELVANGVAVVGTFVLVLVATTLVTHRLSQGIRGSALGALDRSLGFVFGAARGALIVCGLYLLVVWIVPPPDPADAAEEPEVADLWRTMGEARTVPLVAAAADKLKDLVGGDTRSRVAAEAEAAREQARRALEMEETLRRLSAPRPAGPPVPADGAPGYRESDRTNLNRLFETAN